MTLTDFFWGIGDIADSAFTLFHSDVIGNVFNYTVISFAGFFGLLFWLNKQRKFNDQAKNNPNQLK